MSVDAFYKYRPAVDKKLSIPDAYIPESEFN